MDKIFAVSAHADDETLGCGGTLFKNLDKEKYWLVMTNFQNHLIPEVSAAYNFKECFRLRYPDAKLIEEPRSKLVEEVSSILHRVKPDTILVPYGQDLHSDHRVTHDVVMSATKWFRMPFIKKILMYEVITSTENFLPNYYVDITNTMSIKTEVMKSYGSEMMYPRDEESIRTLAKFRGLACNSKYAEGFVLKWERG